MQKNSDINKIVFYDGFCVLCNKTVDFVISHDRKKVFYFAPLQGDTAQNYIKTINPLKAETVCFYNEDKIYTESRAILEIFFFLGGGFKIAYALILIPPFIRNPIYRYIAKKRYSFFGKRDQCRIGLEEENHFLN